MNLFTNFRGANVVRLLLINLEYVGGFQFDRMIMSVRLKLLMREMAIALALEEWKKLGIRSVWMTCDKNNEEKYL